MKRQWLISLALAAAVGSVAGLAVPKSVRADDLNDYKIIIERSPFGAMAGGGANNTPQPSFADRFTFLGLVPSLVSTQMLAVIQDHETNRAELYAEGDTIGDVKVTHIEATPDPKLTLQRGLEVATLGFPQHANAPAAPGMAAPPPGMPGAPPAALGGRFFPRRIPFRRPGQQ